MFEYVDFKELEEVGLSLIAGLLQHKVGKQTDEEVRKVFDMLFDDLTMDDLQGLVLILASFSGDLLTEWAHSISTDPEQLLQRISLVKAIESLTPQE